MGLVAGQARTLKAALEHRIGTRIPSDASSCCVGATNSSEKMELSGTWVHQVARAMEEQLGEDKQELKTREKKKKAKDATRVLGIHENDNKKGTSHVQEEMEKLVRHYEQALLSLLEGWHWDDNKGGWLDLELCAKARRWEVEYVRRHKMYTTVPESRAYVRRTRRPSRHVERRLTRENQESPMCARGGSPPSEALKVVLSEVVTGKRDGKMCRSSMYEGLISTLHQEGERSSNCC